MAIFPKFMSVTLVIVIGVIIVAVAVAVAVTCAKATDANEKRVIASANDFINFIIKI